MKHFYPTSILLLLLFTFHSSFATVASKNNAAPNETNLLTEALAPGDLSATITGDTTFCAGSAGAMIFFEGAGGTAPYTLTYQVDGGSVQEILTSALGIASVPVNTSMAKDITYRITSVKGSSGKTFVVDIRQVITVLKAPVVDFSFTGTACSGSPFQFTSSVHGVGGYTYLWNFGDGLTSTEENPAHEFTSLGCGMASFTVSLTVTDGNGCSTTLSKLITVKQKPDISFSDLISPFSSDPFNNCGFASAGSPDYTIRVGNTSLSADCITSYSINWGDGSSPVPNASFPATHTYKSLGAFDMVITAYGANGCINEITYVVKNINTPSVGITSPSNTTNLCAPTDSLAFEIAKWGTNSPGTIYTVDYGDGSPILTFTQEELKASTYYVASNPSASANFPIPHSYILPNCPNGPYIVKIKATNACSWKEATVDNITVINKTDPDFTIPANACVNSSVVITNTSIPGYNSGCNQNSMYIWDFGDGTTQEVTSTLPKNTSHTYTTPGEYTVRLITRNLCGESSATQVITIDPPLTATATATGMASGTITVCQGAPMQVITFTGMNGTAPYTFTYRIDNGPEQTVETEAGSNSVSINVPTGTAGSFKYTLVSISDASPTACTQVQTVVVTVVVTAPPTGSISGDKTACLNDASPVITFTGSGGTRPYAFIYTINGGSADTITTEGSSNSVILAVPTTAEGDFKYNLIGVLDSGDGTCLGKVSESITVRINPLPAPMTLPNYEYCNGETTSAIIFTNTVANTSYRWTISNTAIGLGASGTGNIPSFTARNTTGSPIVATITVTPSVDGCDGAKQTFTITVHPSAVLFSRGAQTICSGENTAEVTLTSPSGAALSWTATAPAGITGVTASGTNTIPVQTLSNTTSSPITVTYTVQAALPSTDPCAGIQYAYTITVNPRPVIHQVFNPEICSGSVFTVAPENNSENKIPANTRYTWNAPVISPAGAITGASAQATPQSFISQTLVNSTSDPATATYTVTPIANGCAGESFTIVVTVIPLPTATLTGSATVCQNAEKQVVTFTGNNGTAPYTFTYQINKGAVQSVTTEAGNNKSIEVPTDQAGTFTYTLVSVQDKGTTGCVHAQSGSAVIIVQPIPTATISGDATVCSNSPSPVITFTGSGGSRPYTFTYTINGEEERITSTDAASNSKTLIVPTTAAGVFKYTLTGVKGTGTDACGSTLKDSATVTVTALPAAMTLPDYTFCNGEITSVVTFTNTVEGTTYRWSSSNPSIGLAANGLDSIASFTALNATASPISSTITVTPSVNGCDGANQSFILTVQPSPVVTFSTGAQTICSGESTTAVTLTSSTTGAGFSWTADQPAGITGMITSGTGIIPVQALVNSTNAPITVTYRAKATTTGAMICSGMEAAYTVTVSPKAEVNEAFAESICSGNAFTVTPENNADNKIPSTTRYIWNLPVVSPAGAITGASAQASPQAIISQRLVNTTSAAATATYTVTPIVNGCSGESFTIVVTVLPLPTATLTGSATVCQNAERPLVTFTGSNGKAPYTFTYKINNDEAVQILSTDSTSNSVTVEVPTDLTGSFTYTLMNVTDESLSVCTHVQTGSVTVEVSAPPSGTIEGNSTVCLNGVSPVITFTGSGGTRPYTFTYTINGGEEQIINTNATSNIATLPVLTTAAGVFKYNLTGVQGTGTGACNSMLADSATVTITELPAAMTLPNLEYCNGETTSVIVFTNDVTGTIHSWSSSNPSIGLSASGTGNIAPFTALNATSSSVTSTITVNPSVNGCYGASQSFILTVHPSPIVTFSVGAQAICSGENTSAVTPGSSTAGAEFNWTAEQPAGITGMITSGTGIIPVQTLVNSTNAPITVTYRVKATIPGAVNCPGSEAAYSITVNPKPVVEQTFNTSICSGSAFTVTPENNADNSIPSGTVYTWSVPVISPAGAITGAAAQATPQSFISQLLVNTTSDPATATYAVTPIVNGCKGESFILVVTVLPVPEINPVSDITLCHGEQAAEILLSGTAGTVYRWTSDNSSIGIAASGTDQIDAFTAVNTGNSPVQSRITVTPVLANGNATCEGTSVQFTITVNPGAQVNSIEDQKVCSGNNVSIDFTTGNTGGTTTYEWTNSNAAIGLSASGSGTISFVPVNTGNTILSSTITVTPLYTNNGVSCKGTAEVFILTVEPTATVIKPMDKEVCNGYPTDEIRFSGNLPNTVYQWTIDNSSIGLSASGSGDIMPFVAVNNGTAPVVATITVTPVNNGCNGTAVSLTITVNPTPVITQQPVGSSICLGETPDALTVAVRGTGSPSYQWYSNTAESALGGVLIPNATGASYDPPADVAGTVYYYSVITFPNDDCNLLTSAVARVILNPNPVISAVDQEISSGETFSVVPAWDNGNIIPPGTAYIWSDPVVSPANAVSGAMAQAEPQAAISQRLINTTTQTAMVTYTVFPVSGACTGASFKVTVYVDSPLIPNVTVTPIACFGMNNGSITTSIQGGAPYTDGTPYIISWTGPNGFTSTDASIHNLIPGVYHLTITDSRGKQFIADYIITAPEEMVVSVDKRDVSCYGAADGRISITINGGTAPYQTIWTKDNAPFATTEDVSGLTPGTYVITVTDANGCAPIKMSWVISQPEPLVLTLKGKSDIRCFGDSTGYIAIELSGGVMIETAPGVYGYRYHWSGPDGFTSTEKNLSKLPVGDYTLQVTDGSGCSQSLSVSLNGPSPLAVVREITPISCYGANNATVRLDITGGTPPYQADWNNYATGTFQDNLSPGNYTILITDAAQCQISTTVNIPEAPVFRVNPEVKNVSCYGAHNGSIALNFETTLKSIIFKWSDGSRSGTTRNNVGPGTYTVYIQGGDLCMINRTFIVTEPSPMMLSGAVTDIGDCSIVDGGAIDLMVTGGTPPYRYTWSNGAVTEDMKDLQAGNYAVTVADSMGCVQVAQYTVKRPLPLEIDIKTSIDHDCATGDVKAISTAQVSGGITPYQLKWSAGTVSGLNNEQMETRQSGIIVLTVTDQTGCTAIHSFNLEVPNPGITSQVVDCNAHIFQFNGTSAVESQAITYTWDFGDGTGSNLKNPQHAYAAAGAYRVRLTVAGDGPCVSEYEDVVTAAAAPVVGIDKDPKFCRGDSILIYGTGADTYRWNDGTTGDSIWIKREGDYSVTGTSGTGCTDTYNFRASYFDLIGYTIHSDQQEVSQGANRIRLWSENIPYSNYSWDFGDGYTGQGVEVYHSYEITDDGYFDVTLTVINPNGCEEVTTKRIWKSVAAIANTFTPNSDGLNDIFLKGWQIEVFNRNGILMYKGDQGWDGKHDGRLVDNDTYFVIIYDSTQLGATYKKSYVTVLR